MITIDHVIALGSEENAKDLGAMLWTVLGEVSAFYNFDEQRAWFTRTWIGKRSLAPQHAAKNEIIDEKLDEDWWKPLRKQRRFVDQRTLASRLHSMAPDRTGRQIIVTDQTITPPPEWRYIIWEGLTAGNAVVSIATLDPKYWGDRDPHRVNTIKHRSRAALMSITGTSLGFRRCENSRCFLYANVDSVTALDPMVAIGVEHAVPGLINRGFRQRAEGGSTEPDLIDELPGASYEFEA
jgi:hypothetical protein